MDFSLLVLFALVSFFTWISAQIVASSPYPPERRLCPADLSIRSPSEGLSPEEAAWREKRLGNVVHSLHSYLPRTNITGFNITHYLSAINASNVPVVGLAVSGGGTQSGLNGLGFWQAFDERYPPAVKAGTGGLSQCLTYITGLSGGGCVTMTALASHNFSTLQEITETSSFTWDYTSGPNGNITAWYELLFINTYAKYLHKFPVSATDILGQYWRWSMPDSWAYADFSDIASPDQAFAMGLAPMPIVTLAEVVPEGAGKSPSIDNIMYPGANSSKLTAYELTPFEFGSWLGGRIQAFMPTKYLGTIMSQGKPYNKSSCVTGFDKMTYVAGATANAWNFWFIDDFFNIPLFAKRDKFGKREETQMIEKRGAANDSILIPVAWQNNTLVRLVERVAQTFNQTFNQSLWATVPNPFMNYNKAMAGVNELLLVDGSETGETIPLRPLMQKQRGVDFIIAFDSGGDGDNNWVNGTVLLDSSTTAKQAGLAFPTIPDAATMINLKMNKYPTFFGCDDDDGADVPLVLYIPNAPWSAYTNYSYTVSSFTEHQLSLIFANSLSSATYGNVDPFASNGSTATAAAGFQPDTQWPACLACGVIAKSLRRVQMPMPEICTACFERHCWNGTRVENPADPPYDPKLILDADGLGYADWNSSVWY